MILSLQAELEAIFIVKLPNDFPHKTPFRSEPVGGNNVGFCVQNSYGYELRLVRQTEFSAYLTC